MNIVSVVKASLPAVVFVVEKINEPRYATFKGIMAVGISGAIQHRAGMQTSKTIVAVNKPRSSRSPTTAWSATSSRSSRSSSTNSGKEKDDDGGDAGRTLSVKL